ncbi:MAG: sugar ABC transporter permease [Candidatus Gastranaerophilales bacterium]|nr:sugar ABC transporter permease [Candidatus Gastranaerophilales bacterium]
MIQKICNKLKLSEKMNICIFVLPSLLGCALFIFLPSIMSFLLSFFDWNLISNIKFSAFSNYTELLSSYEFWFILKNTLIYAFCVTVFATIIPLILASIIYNGVKAKEFFKTSYFLPFITPMIVIAMIWQWIFDPNIGLVNLIFKSDIQWLYDKTYAMFVIIFVSVWKLTGYNMIIFLSGFSSLNPHVYESAKIDGANGIKTFLNITIPLMSPVIFFVLLITTISSFQVFDLIYLMTQGEPENSTNILVYWLYKNAFEFFKIGKASAIAYILFLLIFILAIIQWRLRKKWVINETD